MEASLQDTLPFRQHACCRYCGTELRRYLPCPHCEQNFNPALPSCPGCGVRPPDEAHYSPVWQIPDRVIAEAVVTLRADARRHYEAARAAKAAAMAAAVVTAPPVAAARPAAPQGTSGSTNGHGPAAGQGDGHNGHGNGSAYSNGNANGKSGGNGNGRVTGKKSSAPSTLPALANGTNGATHGHTAEAPALPPGLQQAVAGANGAPEDGAGALFEIGGAEITSSAATITADYELITEHARLAEVVAELAGRPILAVDTETTGLDPFVDNTLLLVQVATQDRAYVVDARRVDPRPLRRILEDERTVKLLQNAKFDYKMLRQQLGIKMRNMYDTMLAERVLTAGISREIGLARLAQKYAGITLDKSTRASFIDKKTGEFSEEQLRYAARDVLVLFTIYDQQRLALKREKLLDIALLEFKTVVAVGEMELAGCRIDIEHWRKIIEDNKTERDRAANELGEMLADAIPQQSLFGGPAINLNSNAQLIETLGRMGLELPDTMEATLLKYDHPAIKKLLEYRGFEKTISAFGEKFLELIHPKTGRIHPDFNQLGADTGRFSCTNPNVQQIPATSEFRSCFVAAPGYKLITCDYSQAELRILAQLSEDPAFVEAFRSGGDLHQLTASQMFQIPPEEVKKPQRSAAKVINFGLAYGRGPAALGVQLGVSTDEAKRLIDQYFKAYSGIQQWLDRAARDAVRKGYSITIMGRKRYYAPLDRDDPDYNKNRASIERQGKNSPIQGANADMTKLALIALTDMLPDNARVVNTVHDEIVVEAPEDRAEEVCKLVEREMVKAGQRIISLVPIVADAKIGDYWSK
jgi:DNA polymerase I-like protein with 3'-5' exonuclease and polymerase domains